MRAKEIERFGPQAMGCDSFWVAARELTEPKWLVLVARAEQSERFGPKALDCNSFWVAARDL